MTCTHDRAIPGVEGDWCPDCRKIIKQSSDSPCQDWHFVHIYKSHGSQYFRYVWGTGHKISGVRHIPGGNIHNPVSQNRAAQVRSQIESGMQPDEIRKLIDRWTW